jgi:hypothetical protein
MTTPNLRNLGQASMVRSSAISGVPIVPDVANGLSHAGELKRALGDPVLAKAFRHRLVIEALIYVLLIECLLIGFFGIGYLLLH